jgi:hypothetical protein
MMRLVPDEHGLMLTCLLVSGFRPAGSRRPCFHTVNIHEKPPKVNANHQFVILFVVDDNSAAQSERHFV